MSNVNEAEDALKPDSKLWKFTALWSWYGRYQQDRKLVQKQVLNQLSNNGMAYDGEKRPSLVSV